MNLRAIIGRLRASFRQAMRPDANSMVLRQTHVWSRAIIWTIAGTFVAVVLWACLAPMDHVIRAQGKLEPRGSVREVQSPVGGVIAEVLVAEGQTVEVGQPLVRLDPKSAAAEVRSLDEQLESRNAEDQTYERLFNTNNPAEVPENLPQEIRDLAKTYSALVAEEDYLHALLQALDSPTGNPPSDSSTRLANELRDYEENLQRVSDQLLKAREIEKKTGEIVEQYRELYRKGSSSDLELRSRELQWIQSLRDVKNLESQKQNLPTAFRKEILARRADNEKRLAEVVANLSKARLANQQQISETRSRLEAAREALAYHEIKSPSSGIVFEIVSSKPGAVVGAKDVVLKIVPSGELIAKVDILNSEIGFISPGLPCEVEVETFPKREFGYIDGEVYFIGSDSLPPTDVKPFSSFPAKISLARQNLSVRGRDIPLQSGMSVGVNIKTRKRLVVNLFLDSLLGPVEKMREVR
jgi:hemolysin D